MAWNEPGGNGNNGNGNDNDPWGNRKNSGGPPDLDEFFKNLTDKLNGLFGGNNRKRSSGGGGNFPNAPKLSGMAVSVIGSLLFIGWLLTGLYVIQPAESGVVTQFGRHVQTTQSGLNWHIPWPIQTVTRVNTQEINSAEVSRQPALTKDENLVEVALNVQYRIASAENYLFNVRQPEDTVRQSAESALREVVGRTEMNPLITTGRDVVSLEVEQNLQRILSDYNSGIEITEVNLTYSEAPEQVRGAFEDVIKAREDKERFISESEAYRNEILPRARGDAQRVLEEAEAYKARVTEASVGESQRFLSLLSEYKKAPGVTRDRLYLESMEEVLSNTSKVLVGGNDGGGSNSLMYLPLDKLMEGRQTPRANVNSLPSNVNQSAIGNTGLQAIPSSTPERSTSVRDSLRSRDRGAN